MFSSFRNRFGIPGVISVIALVFAMLGGAYAANNDGGNATASAKAKKGPRGPKGAKGDTGPAGPQGLAGPAGAKGDTGAAGANGKDGAQGATGATGLKGATGATGVTGTTGVTGSTGPTGFSGFTATLPPGETETGTLTASVVYHEVFETGIAQAALTYPIPLAVPLSPSSAKLVEKGTTAPAECAGGTPTAPAASPGFVCIYETFASTAPITSVLVSGNPAGGMVLSLGGTPGAAIAATYAVTAEE